MELIKLCILLMLFFISSSHFFTVSDCRRVHKQGRTIHKSTKFQLAKYLDVIGQKVDHQSNTQPYVSSPFTLPPFDSLPPYSTPDINAPPYCSYPSPPPPPFYHLPYQSPPRSPSPSPNPISGSPPSFTFPSPPYIYEPSPPSIYEPSPPSIYESSPPYYYEPSPPYYNEPSPKSPVGYVPSPTPTVFVPSPGVFEPPVIYPPPSVPPPPKTVASRALWCVAKPSVPDPIIQEAMNYACGTVADCESILPNGSCFEPNTLIAHASYAFNSYWQRTKVGGGTCEFGGTAMLVTVDPSYDGCHFIYT